MDEIKRNKLIDSLYTRCQVRVATSKDVFDGIVKDLGVVGTAHIVDKAVEIIRPYKNTGTKLEATVDALYALLYPADANKEVTQNIKTWG